MKKGEIKGKKAVIFDIDNTLLNTHILFTQAYSDMRILLKERFGDILGEEIMNSFMFDMYDEKGRYFNTLNMITISESFSNDLVSRGLIEDTKEERFEMERLFKGIYDEFPEFLPGAEDLLKYLHTKGFVISFCTHSGEWGHVKAETIWRKMKFPKKELKYLTIPLEEKKDKGNWLKVVTLLGLKPSDVVVVGDNKEADILASQEIGVDTCIWYKYLIKEKDTDFYTKGIDISRDNCIVYEVNSLEDIKELF
jgi:FMN phosphatase YigB (HAD superfamily)